MQKITPCLWFDSNAEEAAKFYTSVFPNSNITQTMKYNVETPSNKPVGSVMTVEFEIDGYKFLGLNGGPFFKPNPSISFHVKCKTKYEVDAIWEKLSQGGTVLMPLDKYPFSERYGWIQDKFGFSWQIIFVSDKEIKKRISPVLMFVGNQAGNAEEAVNLYIAVFKNAKVESIVRYIKGEEPEIEGTVKYAVFTLFDQDFGIMDSVREHQFNFNEAISLMITCENQKEINYFYEKLSADPKAEICGWLKDKYGVSWQIVPTVLADMLSDKDIKKSERVMKVLLKMKKLDIKRLEKAYNST